MAGLAELIVGHVPTARAHFEAAVAAGRNPDIDHTPVRAAARQLITVERLAGDLDAARQRHRRLPTPSSRLEEVYAAQQLALVEIQAGRVEAARESLRANPLPLDGLRSSTREALGADAAMHLLVLARCERRLGNLDAAGALLAEADARLDDRTYARAELLLEEGWLAHDAGRRSQAETLATASLAGFDQVGAVIDVGRARLLLALVRRDPAELELADAAFRDRGAIGHLPDVDSARAVLTSG